MASIFENDFRTDNVGYDGRADLEVQTDFGPLSTVELGGRYERIEFYSEAPQNIPSAASLLAAGDRNGDGILTVDELPSLDYNNKQGSFFPGVSGETIRVP